MLEAKKMPPPFFVPMTAEALLKGVSWGDELQ
jgi:hypothetical protein